METEATWAKAARGNPAGKGACTWCSTDSRFIGSFSQAARSEVGAEHVKLMKARLPAGKGEAAPPQCSALLTAPCPALLPHIARCSPFQLLCPLLGQEKGKELC